MNVNLFIHYLKHPIFTFNLYYRKWILGQNLDVQRLRITVLIGIESDPKILLKKEYKQFVEMMIPEIAKHTRAGMSISEATKKACNLILVEEEFNGT